MRAARWLPLFALGVAAACGGRTTGTLLDNREETSGIAGSANAKQGDPDASSSNDPGVASAGTDSTRGGSGSVGGGTTGSGAMTSAGGALASTAGSPSFGAGGTPGACQCHDDIQCQPGYVLSEQPERCCRCVIDCPSVGCLELDCPQGSHEVFEDDECCPTCALDQPLSCDEARQQYDELRSELLTKLQGLGCIEDADCAQFWEYNRCSLTCGNPVPLAGQETIEDELETFAGLNCGNCEKIEPVPCARPKAGVCVDGWCL